MPDKIGLGLDLKDHFPFQGVADQLFIKMGEWIQREAVREFARAHAEQTVRLALDQGVNFLENAFDICIESEKRDIEIVLQDTVGTIQRAMGLGVDGPVLAAKVIRAGSRAGFEERSFETRDPEVSFARTEGHFFKIMLEPFLAADKRDRHPAEIFKDLSGQRKLGGLLIQVNMLDFEGLF